MKLPSYIVQNLFYRLGLNAEPVKSSSVFVHKAKCPLCADHAQRLYLREYSSFYSVKCHNCGYNGNFESFLKENYPNEYEELRPFILNSIKDGSIFAKRKCLPTQSTQTSEPTSDLIDVRLKMYLKEHAFKINKKQESDKKEELRKRIIKYLKGRKIPESIYKDFYCMLKGPLKGYIGIPFFDKNKENLVHIQGRLFVKIGEGDRPKYLFLKDTIDGIELDGKEIWGLWRTDPNKHVIICEGTLDACAFEHGVATCGATMGDSYIEIIKKQFPNRIWCIDSFWTDIEGRKLTIKLLKMGERCFILPKNSTVKDANELLCKELNTDYITDEVIEENTYTGRFGLIKLRTMEVTTIGN